MSTMGKTRTITGVLDASLDKGPLKPLNRLSVKYYCPYCYATDLYYREIEPLIFDITCLSCNKHWIKHKKIVNS